jgi:hypothetical protein
MNELMTETAKANFQRFCEVYARHFREKRYHSPPAYAHQQFMREVIALCSNGKHTSYRCADFNAGNSAFKYTYFFDYVFPYLERHEFPTPDGGDNYQKAFEDFKAGFLHAEHGPEWLTAH